jgi:hypothetical protein
MIGTTATATATEMQNNFGRYNNIRVKRIIKLTGRLHINGVIL